ncbi:MAG: hypothetical protein LUC83_02585 [Clostridiales bacterium]|nr:hypothetical protein [Clostridiales bacterium]
MGETEEKNIMELLELYMDVSEKQDEVIFRLASIVKKQAREIKHMRSVYGFFEENPSDLQEEQLADETLRQYEAAKAEER